MTSAIKTIAIAAILVCAAMLSSCQSSDIYPDINDSVEATAPADNSSDSSDSDSSDNKAADDTRQPTLAEIISTCPGGYYDGCNSCGNGICTERYCDPQEYTAPRCH